MTTPTPENVAPLVQDLVVRGRSVQLRLVCPRSGHAVSARATAPASSTTAVATRMKSTVSRTLLYSLRRTIANLVRGIFGHGVVGRLASDLAYTALSEAQRGRARPGAAGLSAAEQQEAVVAAFQSVATAFVWDPEGAAWISAKAAVELLGAFQRQLSEHPVLHPYDRQVLARMLVEVARADGRVSPEESSWLTEMITADQGSVDDIANRPPLTTAELRSTSPTPIRRSLLLLAHALALVDENLDPAELQALSRFGQGLELSPRDQEEIGQVARTWVLDQALDRMATWGGHDAHAREQLYALAGRLGMSQPQAEQAEARFLRRSAR